MGTDNSLRAVEASCSDALNAIAGLFKPGVRITLLVRTPGEPDRDFLMTSEADLSEAAAMIERRRAAGADRG